MRHTVLLAFALTVAAIGCGGTKETPPVTDPDAIRKEQERLRNEMPSTRQAPANSPGR